MKRNRQPCPVVTSDGPQHWKIVLRIEVGNVKRAMLAHPTNMRLILANLRTSHGYGTKMSPRDHDVAFLKSQHHVIDSTNPRRALDDGIEHWLHVRRRPADD